MGKATHPNKHIKKSSKIFNSESIEVFQGKILREIDDDFSNDTTNSFKRMFHVRKFGYINLNFECWFIRQQIVNNEKMLLSELNDWKINKDGIRWKCKKLIQLKLSDFSKIKRSLPL